MKFLRIIFRRFGPFEEQTIDISGPSGLQIIFGKNEAGKSSALRGMLAFLFGFDNQSKDNFRFHHKEFRVHALLENAALQQLECVRRKGHKDTLRKSCDKEVLPDRQLSEFLGGLDQVQFKQLFGLDADELRRGGDSIADGKGELGEALFEAGAGMKDLRVLSQSLLGQQEALYVSGGRKQVITEAIREYRSLIDQAVELALPPDIYAAAETAANDANGRVEELAQERVAVRYRLALLNRYKAALPTIDLLRTARERLAPVADAPLLSTDFDAKLEKAREKYTTATNELANLESKQKELTDLVKTERPSNEVLREETEIGELKKQVGADVKSREEEFKATTFSIDERGKARDIYRELTGSTDWEQMDDLKPRLDERNRINRLANERSAAVEDVNRQEKSIRDTRKLLVEARDKQSNSPLPPDPTPWQDAVDEVTAAGNLEDQLQKLRNTVETDERRLADDFARFNPAPPGIWRKAPAMSVPLAEAVECFRQELDDARGIVERVAGEKRKSGMDIATIRASLDRVSTEPVPTVQELAVARRDRDGGLQCIRLRLNGQIEQQSEIDFTTRHAPGRPLIDAAETAVRHCDTLADRLRHEADRVAAFQALQQQVNILLSHVESLDVEERDAQAVLAATEHRWQTVWQTAGISPDTPKVMQTWLSNWARFVERVAKWQFDHRQYEECRTRIDTLRVRLTGTCPAAQKARSLVEGLVLAKRAIVDAISARSELVKVAESVNRLQVAVAAAEDEEAKARLRRDEWDVQWTQAVSVLRLNDASPAIETAQDYLIRIDQMQLHLRDMRLKDARVREIRNDRARLIERINALQLRLDPKSRPTTAESLDSDFRDVESALQGAIARRTRHQEFTKQLDEVEKTLARTKISLAEAGKTLQALAAEASVDIEAIPAAVQRARERAEATSLVRRYEEALAQNALGEPMESFLRSALANREELDQQLDELSRSVERLDAEVSAAEAVSREAERNLECYLQASSAAAEAQQNATLLATRLKDKVVEYAAIHLARKALETAKENYRKRNEGTLLDWAGEYFRRLTDDGFSGIDIDNEDGVDVLVAVRAATNRSDVRVPVSGMSDGTRDQLFLALRLAGIEHHLKDREPVPLIVDDVLVNFDDNRAKATLGCLAELAKKTQVLVFTHHRHVVELARAVDSSVNIHELASPSTL